MRKLYALMIVRDNDTEAVREKRQGYLQWFCSTFPTSHFRMEDFILRVYAEYCANLQVDLARRYMDDYLELNLRSILVLEHIHVSGTESISFDDPVGLSTAVLTTKHVILDIFEELEAINENVDDFKVGADVFRRRRLNERLTEVLQEAYSYIQQDSAEALDYISNEVASMQYIYGEDIIEELDYNKANNDYGEFVCDSGISFIDNDIRGLYSGQLGGVEAQPGAGKTRFVLGVWVYRAITVFKKNVIFYALEQSRGEVKAILVARHLFALFGIQMDSKYIYRNEIPAGYEEKVEAAKIDLFESGKYGKCFICDRVLYLDTFIGTITMLDKLHGPFDVLAVDYMGLIEQFDVNKPRRGYIEHLKDYQVIGRAFRWFKRYLKKTRKSGIGISQFNEKGISAGLDDELITTFMAQGGIEVYRNTDWNLALSFTTEMKVQQKMRVSQPKVRDSGGFGRAMMDTRLGFAYFYQMKRKEM